MTAISLSMIIRNTQRKPTQPTPGGDGSILAQQIDHSGTAQAALTAGLPGGQGAQGGNAGPVRS